MNSTEWQKVLFLDVDGVLNSKRWFAENASQSAVSVDPVALARLRRVIDATGCALVLSSTWRLVPQCVADLESLGLVFLDKTPTLHKFHRGEEIFEWLKTHRNVGPYAIVDDDADAGDGFNLESHFVQTTWNDGLLDEHIPLLITILGGAV